MSTANAPPQETTTGRDHNGRFSKGNPGGPGNPFARQVAQLRKRLLDRLTGEDLDGIADKLIALAKEGDVPATKLLFTYTLGQPADAVQPDQLDVEEWDTFKKTATMAGELPGIMATPDPSFPLAMVRAARPGVARDLAKDLQATLKAGEEEDRQRQQRREERRQRRRDRKQQRCERAAAVAARTATRPTSQLSSQDLEARTSLAALAKFDSQALERLAGMDCPPVAQAPPSPNRCNGAKESNEPTVPVAGDNIEERAPEVESRPPANDRSAAEAPPPLPIGFLT
jgi:hypothetical protein